MKRIRALFEQGRSRASDHPFFEWLHGPGAHDRFVFTPLMVDFTMGFADMNKWFLSYAQPEDELQQAINQHTLEDRTHSRLFIENWRAFELDQKLGWGACHTLWWLYHCEQTLPVRKFGWEILGLATRSTDAMVRFALMEAIEICGDVFFRNTAREANKLSRKTGIDYRYYGEYHQLRETGHLHTDESPFFVASLSEAQYQQAKLACERIFDGFLRVLDRLLEYCQAMSTQGLELRQALQRDFEAAVRPRDNLRHNRTPREGEPPQLPPSQLSLHEHLRERVANLERHPLLGWLRDAPHDGAEKLRRFAPLWAIDIAAYPDFTNLALPYPRARTPAEAAFNRWAHELGTHGIVYLQDWTELELDRQLSWSAGETISFCFLGDVTEVHRRNLARVTQLAFRHADPLERTWLMWAFESGADPLFDAVRAALPPDSSRAMLNYWREQHTATDLDGGTRDALHGVFAHDISPERQRCISETIDTVFDGFEEQFTLSHQHAVAATLTQAPHSLVPANTQAPRFAPQAAHGDAVLRP